MSPHPYLQQHASALPARSLALDLYRGVVWGDFDRDLGTGGAIAQSTVGFIPVVGTVAALRDLLACIEQRDALGAVLNFLAVFPVLGGFAKIADALHTVHRYRRSAQRRKQRKVGTSTGHEQLAVARRSGWATFGLSLLLLGFAALYGFGVRVLFDFLGVYGPTIQGYTVRGSGAWLAPLILFSLGLLVGVGVALRNRLWLGLLLFPFAMACGFFLAGLV
jgi:hypothetical protein